ncbi:AraC family transcriptional regulator [Variovorax robiniae]|uniref:AraC family transcriptional regulator n=1 Tax=Variovorax robiniae TaxID=1836199 RepID=A0ABU8XIN8_9BURK
MNQHDQVLAWGASTHQHLIPVEARQIACFKQLVDFGLGALIKSRRALEQPSCENTMSGVNFKFCGQSDGMFTCHCVLAKHALQVRFFPHRLARSCVDHNAWMRHQVLSASGQPVHLTRVPSPLLRPIVQQMWASAPGSTRPAIPNAREHVLPTGCMHLVFRLSGPPLRLFTSADDGRGSHQTIGYAIVGGARSSFYVRDVAEPTSSVGALLRPGAALALLGAPEDALAGCHTPLELLWGRPRTGMALERLHAAKELVGQLGVLESLLTEALGSRMHGLQPAIAWALEALARGDAGIGEVAARSGYSHRRFIALFRGATGLTPKAWARVKRLDRVLALAGDPTLGWAEIAAHAGFSDQAHLTREFGELAGLPPQAWRRAAPVSARHVPR